MLNRFILLIYYASSGLKRTGLRFIADSLHPDVFCARDQLFPNPLWFPLLQSKWVWLSWSLSTQEWKSTATITAMSYSLSRCCQRSSMLQAIRLSFNNTTLSFHRAKDTMKLLQQETPNFIGPDLWSPNSPDLNLVDCKVWGVVQ